MHANLEDLIVSQIRKMLKNQQEKLSYATA